MATNQSYKTIIYEKLGKIARITLNRPEVRNALNMQLIQEYLAALDVADNDPGVAVIVVTGAGTVFSSGVDLKERKEEGAMAHRPWTELFYWKMMDRVRALTKPIIASLNGPARAGGCTVAFACDIIIAADTASIGYPEPKRGILPGIHIWHIQRIAGRMKAAELLFTGEPIGVVEAERIGLISKVVPADKLEQETLALASKIADISPLTLKMMRELFYRVENMDYPTAVRTIGDTVCLFYGAEDSKEGRRAFAEKRKPEWQSK